jgi:hypothetical protein
MSEIVYSHNFTVTKKTSIFSEIFYSPYLPEVLRISLGSWTATSPYHPMYTGQKSIWADLEAGNYLFEIVVLSVVPATADVSFQLILK